MHIFLAVAIGGLLTFVGCLLFYWRGRKPVWGISLVGSVGAGLAAVYTGRVALAAIHEPLNGSREELVDFGSFVSAVFGLALGTLVVHAFRRRLP